MGQLWPRVGLVLRNLGSTLTPTLGQYCLSIVRDIDIEDSDIGLVLVNSVSQHWAN